MSQMTEKYQADDTFREVANLLFGGGEDELVSKMNPDGADLNAKKRAKAERTQARVGLATNAIGIGAGAAATLPALRAVGAANREYKGMSPKPAKRPGKLKGKWIKATSNKKAALGLAAGAAGLQVANLAGDAVANRVLSRAAKDKSVSKGIDEIPENASFPSKGKLTRAAITSASRAHGKGALQVDKGKFKRLPEKVTTKNVKKNLDVRWEGEISKVNDEKRQVFGWASVVEMNGEPVVDLQGDYITIDEVEKSAYEYVHKSRRGGDMHLRNEDGEPKVGSHMIESFVVTEEKKKALGLPDSAPTGWWVGYQVNDEELWNKVKSNERTGFSIHGRGVRN